MQKELDTYLVQALQKLEAAHDKILKTQGYNTEAEKMQLLRELIKEQVKNENSSNTAR